MKIIFKLFIIFIIFIFFSKNLLAKDTWILNKDLSSISFEIPVLFFGNIKGEFKKIEGLVEIDTINKKENKAIFSAEINSIQINYEKYRNLLLSNIFFDELRYPIALVDTKKFSYLNENKININVELTIKGISKYVPINIKINKLADELVQIKSEIKFSRKLFDVGTGKWSSGAILKDTVTLKVNLFLFKD